MEDLEENVIRQGMPSRDTAFRMCSDSYRTGFALSLVIACPGFLVLGVRWMSVGGLPFP